MQTISAKFYAGRYTKAVLLSLRDYGVPEITRATSNGGEVALRSTSA